MRHTRGRRAQGPATAAESAESDPRAPTAPRSAAAPTAARSDRPRTAAPALPPPRNPRDAGGLPPQDERRLHDERVIAISVGGALVDARWAGRIEPVHQIIHREPELDLAEHAPHRPPLLRGLQV